MMHGPIVKVAAVQAAPALLDIEKSVAKTIELMDQAGQQGVQLIAFPETWIAGYPWWIWLGTPEYAMHFVGDYFANSIEANSDYDLQIQEAAKRNNLHAVIGVSERSGTSLYMGQWHYGSDGKVMSRRRKLKPTMAERPVFGEGDGSDIVVNDTEIGRIGALCCWEHMQPLLKYAMFSEHEQIHVASWPAYSVYTEVSHAMSPEMSMAINQTYAAEGQCFVLSSCAVISKEIRELLCDTYEKKRLVHLGGGYSRIFGPDGASMANHIDPEEEGLTIAEIPLGKIAFAKAAADPVGHYSRLDVLQLLVDKRPRNVVRSIAPVNDLELMSQVDGDGVTETEQE